MPLTPEQLGTLGLDDFTAIDLETTGLDPNQNEVIEFGAVRFVDGRPAEGVSQLIQPQKPLPEIITRITGISPQDVAAAPLAHEVLPALLARWTVGRVVAHNLDFELGFLTRAAKRFEVPAIAREAALDTLLLARTLAPKLFNHKLDTLARHFDITRQSAHRARDDAEAAGWVLLELVERALSFDRTVLASLRYLAPPGMTKKVFQGLEQLASPAQEEPETPFEEPATGPALGDWRPQPLDLEAVTAPLRKGGAMARAVDEFEERTEQLAMTRAVGEAFNAGRFLVAEAGTGVGKSFAYLLPALLWAQSNPGPGGRVVLSTRTKTLQDQLFDKDIPRLMRAMGLTWNAVLLKGRQNYLCLRRLDGLFKQGTAPAEQAALMPLVAWLGQTQTGDLDEAHGVWRRDLRRRVNDDPEYCVGRRCQFYEQCYSINARNAARGAQLVVVNHALLLADLALDGGILGDYRHLILDEAHHLEEAARQALQQRLAYVQFSALYDELLRSNPSGRDYGLLTALGRRVPDDDPTLAEALARASQPWPALKGQTLAFFDQLAQEVTSQAPPSGGYTIKQRFGPEAFAALADPLQTLQHALKAALDDVENVARLSESALGEDEEAVDALRAVANNLAIQTQTLQWLLGAAEPGYVFWVELPQGRSGPTLFGAPLDVGEPLGGLYERLRTLVSTSATLSVGGKFNYHLQRTGLDRLEPDQVACHDFGQPFDHERAVHLSVPAFLPAPNTPEFAEALATLLREVTTLTQRRTLALFTSYRLIQDVYGRLREGELFVRMQAPDEPRGRVLEEFRNGPKAALLLGTDSFWEGIDLPGDALEVLVLTKVPFPVPSDPLVRAEEERLAADGKSAFSQYSLPKAILTLRQGFGRLLRSRSDRGAVILADARVLQKGYGKHILDALPCKTHTYRTPSLLYTDLKRFFAAED